ncbi:S-adenosyl-L-methionine-dependent methyltransferase [Exophiala viscosa]|uniref:S-adenosyl-L-methionine-dependent methyltransferase n=1 Tax=Exophiala viscosa TaxID=2486360 RepID=A0AAN6DSM9_9EURO|nr:S-adenosyl-L-methionine-dependent methyltransferase [Exophiala viscosa]KAI1623340.1 S-adenosyl-L-methionine-dependent methyltransferase [Exophiala viscosa]
MSLLQNLVQDISSLGTKLYQRLGDDTGHLYEAKPWKTYDHELPDRESWQLSQQLIADCEELIALLTPTKIKLVTECVANNSTVGLGVAADFRIADKIIENGGEASLSHLARKCKTDEHKLGCVMHMLVQRHIFKEVAPDVFANNRHSYELRKETGATEMMLIETNEGYQAGLGWLPVMKDPEKMHEHDPAKGAFATALQVDLGVLPYLGTPKGANLLNNFSIGVPWLSGITVVATRTDLPWDSFGPTVCDVGAGPGGVMLEVHKKYPHLNIICQELEQMIPVLQDTFKDYQSDLDHGNVKLEVYDYFTPQKTVADVYWLRGVVRDYDDDTSARLLAQLVPALKKNPRAKVLVNELIVPSLITPQSQIEANTPAAKRLPPNQSGYPQACHMMQLSTMVLMGGKERTFGDIVKIGRAAGLRVSKFHQFRMFTGTIEFELDDVAGWETGTGKSRL